jgi:DNA polymerase V
MEMTGIKGKSGGFREGAGRKQKFKEPTKVIRVPVSLIPAIEKMMAKLEKKADKKKD